MADDDWTPEDLLRRGEVLGAELDTEYRVLAITVQPRDDRAGEWWPASDDDSRLLLVLYPVGDFGASLRRRSGAATQLMTFEAEQLPQIIGLFEHAVPEGDPWPTGRPNRGEWGPRLSLQGTSAAPDGRARHVHLAFVEGDLHLDLHATFDEIQVRDPSGDTL